MASPKRNRRSRSDSRSPEPSHRHKRSLDLVSTRRISPPHHQHHFRGRGRPFRRPFYHRDSHGITLFRGNSQRYYPRQRRFSNREESYSHRRYSRSSRSRSRGHSRERSTSRDRHKRSRSKSSSSGSSSPPRRHRSWSHEHHHSSSKDVKSKHSRGSSSPETKAPIKKKPRHRSSPSPERRHSHKMRSRSKEKVESSLHSERRPRSKRGGGGGGDGDYSRYLEGKGRGHHEEDEGKYREEKFREKSRSRSASPEISRSKKAAPAPKGKEVIPKHHLHKIFSLISQDADFELEEDISIAIQRNPYAEPSEDSTVTVVFDPHLFTMIYPYEGRKHKPIFEREELKVFGHDKNLADDPDFERRVIRLKPGKSSQQLDSAPSSSYHYQSSLEITRTIKRSSSSSRSRSRSSSLPRHKGTKFRLRVSTDPRFEARYAELQRKEELGSSRHSNLDPTDLRHELSSSRKSSSDTRSRVERDRDRDHPDDRRRSSDARESRVDQRKEKEELPDYSRRKDKYQYTPWLDQPELIPRDPKYFLHDDREGHERGRGRGRARFSRGRFTYRRPFRPFRPRGSYRGTYRGRGSYSSDSRSRSPRRYYSTPPYDTGKSVEREWKHDKFSELERDGEKKSHRDDDQHPHSTSETTER